jgi:hypothetical protein
MPQPIVCNEACNLMGWGYPLFSTPDEYRQLVEECLRRAEQAKTAEEKSSTRYGADLNKAAASRTTCGHAGPLTARIPLPISPGGTWIEDPGQEGCHAG